MRVKFSMPKTINVQLELDRLGIDSEVRTEELVSLQFPEILPPEYMELWSQFIETQSVKDLFNSYRKPQGLLYCALSFVSYVTNIDSTNYFDIARFSRQCLMREVQNKINTLKPLFKQKLFYKFPLVRTEASIDDTFNEVVNAYYQVKGNIYFVLGNNNAKEKVEGSYHSRRVLTPFNTELYKYSSYMFGNSVPPESLLGVKNPATGKRKFEKHSNLTKIKHFKWEPLDFGKVQAYALRLDENTMAIRVPIELDMLYFTGSDKPTVVNKRLEYQVKQTLRKLYE